MIFNIDSEIILEKAKRIRVLLLDVDGVLTDGKLYFSNSGEELKTFSTLDGHGLRMLSSAGIRTGIITGRESDLVRRRAEDLGMELLYQGRVDKLNALNEIIAANDFTADEISYVGDDIPDLPALQNVGLSFSVPLGHADVRREVDAVTDSHGGAGAVREICDYLLKAQNKYQSFLS